ncbi:MULTISPECIES: LacI family DNA-binding transcriptional regulator [unclassified Paenibacillus]|uniref:LacI family DNA-binding transcriptional regulator n=1 Tax=unclassified Paenibacillus TaxID=185978 RepID=UPI002F40A36E
MTSIKDIAKFAQVAQGTASIVLNGKGDQYRISSATQKRILDAAKALDYRPNISARRLRSGGETVAPIIALFWTIDTRTSLIGRFLKSIQNSIFYSSEECELLIQPYVGSDLSSMKSLITGTRYNGAIIANPTEEDEQYLEESNPMVPIVLYQRSSTKYSCVNVDNSYTGMEVARLFANRGHQDVGIIIPDVSSAAIRLRKEGFLAEAKELGLKVADEHIIYSEFSEKGGYNAAMQLLESSKKPSALFILSDQISVGVINALNEKSINVPEEIEIVGHDDDDFSQFTTPPLTTMHLPVEEMATASVEIMLDLINHHKDSPIVQNFETKLLVRKSCGGFISREDL